MADFDEVGRMPFQTAQAPSSEGNKHFPASWGHTGPKSWEAGLLRAPHLWFASSGGASLSPSTWTPVRGLCIGEQLTRWQSRPHQWPAAQGLLLSLEKGPPAEGLAGLGEGFPPCVSVSRKRAQSKPTWLPAKPVSQGPHLFLSES